MNHFPIDVKIKHSLSLSSSLSSPLVSCPNISKTNDRKDAEENRIWKQLLQILDALIIQCVKYSHL